MASSTYRIRKTSQIELTTVQRVLAIAFVCGIQMIYIPTSARTHGGIEPKLPIDIFPIWTIWVVPYLLCYLLWLGGLTWAIIKLDDPAFRAFVLACMFTCTVGVSIFIFFPTYIKPASLHGSDIFTTLLHFIHGNWGRYDAFPSGHVYITTLMALFFSRIYPRAKFFWSVTVIVVVLSTLFTGQHYIADALGGLLIAFAGYHFGAWYTQLQPAHARSGSPVRRN